MKLDRQFGLYVIREQLAVHEISASCRAEDPFFDRDVVLKLITPAAVGCRENLNRLNSYLEAVSGLEHPAIAPIYDNGIEGDTCYYTTAIYAGGSLADQLDKPMGIDRGMRILLQLSGALAYAYNEGFEQGKLSLKDIFFSQNGQSIITDFGVAVTIKGLKRNKRQSASQPQNLCAETMHSLGEILIKLLLGPGAKPDTVSLALLKQTHSQSVVKLVSDMLALNEQAISNFDELLARLTELANLGSETGIDEYVEQTQLTRADGKIACINPDMTPAQRQLEIKEAVYAKGEIRRLVAEKSKLQEILRRATLYKRNAEIKLAEGAEALEAAQKAETRTTNELRLATLQMTGQKRAHWHPAVWIISGLLIGSLLTNGYNHLHQPSQAELQVQSQPQLTAPEPATVSLPAQSNQAPLTTLISEAPVQTEAELWWPAGNEFESSAAIPAAMVTEAQQGETPDFVATALTPSSAAPLLASIASELTPAQDQEQTSTLGSEAWWPVGNEFDASVDQTEMVTSQEDGHEVLDVVQDWAKAWSNQDQDSYFSYYSEAYRPEQGQSQEEWRSIRLSRLTRPQWIKVILHDLQLRSLGKDRIQVKLIQSYSSNYFQDQVLKSLNLIKENGQWRILTERSLGAAMNTEASTDMVGG